MTAMQRLDRAVSMGLNVVFAGQGGDISRCL